MANGAGGSSNLFIGYCIVAVIYRNKRWWGGGGGGGGGEGVVVIFLFSVFARLFFLNLATLFHRWIQLKNFRWISNVPIGLSICCIGIIGNILSVVVWSRLLGRAQTSDNFCSDLSDYSGCV